MKLVNVIFIFTFLFSCYNAEFKSFYPAYPPVGIELILLTAANHGGVYVGDYLLLFRSENRKNSKFGGFLIFIDPEKENLLLLNSKEEALNPSLGLEYNESSSTYNPGIDTQVAILFTNNPAPATIMYNLNSYTITKILQPNAALIPGNWLSMRSYLWDSTNAVILEVSEPGNIVQIQ